MDTGKETRMTVKHFFDPEDKEMLLEYLPDGVILEIAWEGADEERA